MTSALLTVTEAAAHLHTSPATVYRRIASREIAWTNIADRRQRPRIRITTAALDAYIQARTSRPRIPRRSA